MQTVSFENSKVSELWNLLEWYANEWTNIREQEIHFEICLHYIVPVAQFGKEKIVEKLIRFEKNKSIQFVISYYIKLKSWFDSKKK